MVRRTAALAAGEWLLEADLPAARGFGEFSAALPFKAP